MHRRGWRSSLRDHACPHLGHMPIADIDTDAVLRVLRPIWDTKTETARAVRQRVEMILTSAKVEGLRTGENPATWKGHLDHLLPRHRRTQRHHDALLYTEMPEFWRSLVSDTSDAAALVRFTIATAARYSEAALADWSEIDKGKRLWTVPPARMKGGREHVVPLSDAALAVLKSSRTETGLIFPGLRSGKKMSDVALAKCIRRHTDTPATLHGFRSCFRDGPATRPIIRVKLPKLRWRIRLVARSRPLTDDQRQSKNVVNSWSCGRASLCIVARTLTNHDGCSKVQPQFKFGARNGTAPRSSIDFGLAGIFAS